MKLLPCGAALVALVACSRDLTVPPARTDTTPPARVTDLHALIVPVDGGFVLGFQWTAPYDPDDAVIDRYEIRASDETITEDNFDAASLLDARGLTLTAGRQTAFAVPPPKFSKFLFAIRAFDKAGNAGPVGLAIDSPLSLLPPDRIADFRVAQTLPGAVLLQWTDTGAYLDAGTASGYDLRASFQPVPDGGTIAADAGVSLSFAVAPQAAGTERTALVTGLFSHVDFWLSLAAVGPAGEGADSPAVHARLPLGTLPPRPTHVTVQPRSSPGPDGGLFLDGRGATVTWDPALAPSGLPDPNVARHMVLRVPAESALPTVDQGALYATGTFVGDAQVVAVVTPVQSLGGIVDSSGFPGSYVYAVYAVTPNTDYSPPAVSATVALIDKLPPPPPSIFAAPLPADQGFGVRFYLDVPEDQQAGGDDLNPDRSYLVYASGRGDFADGGTLVMRWPGDGGGCASPASIVQECQAVLPGDAGQAAVFLRAVGTDQSGNLSAVALAAAVPGAAAPTLPPLGSPAAAWLDEPADGGAVTFEVASLDPADAGQVLVRRWTEGQATFTVSESDFTTVHASDDGGILPIEAVGYGPSLGGQRMLWAAGAGAIAARELSSDGGVADASVGFAPPAIRAIWNAPGKTTETQPGDPGGDNALLLGGGDGGSFAQVSGATITGVDSSPFGGSPGDLAFPLDGISWVLTSAEGKLGPFFIDLQMFTGLPLGFTTPSVSLSGGRALFAGLSGAAEPTPTGLLLDTANFQLVAATDVSTRLLPQHEAANSAFALAPDGSSSVELLCDAAGAGADAVKIVTYTPQDLLEPAEVLFGAGCQAAADPRVFLRMSRRGVAFALVKTNAGYVATSLCRGSLGQWAPCR